MTITADEVYAAAPFVRTLGVEFVRIAPDGVVGQLRFTPALSTVGGAIHGGALMSLADACAAVCAWANGTAGAVPATSDSTTHFLAPVTGRATATATPVNVGKRRVVVDVAIHDDEGRLCVRVIQTVRLLRPSLG
ncbi:PaaI family thioesterase [Actinoplanes sp. NPDC048967]|uniref:PaaI family thioesterase n=1 Tax=Actinoplanes sp. NPDC048967 TaxID=3155269 RepID=UPI0033DD8E97